MSLSANAELVRRWCREWPGLPPGEMLSFFTPDFVYRHVSLERPIVGGRALAGAVEIFRARFEQIDSQVQMIAEIDGSVLCERLENFVLPGGKRFSLPAMAAVELREGRIALWRDYFDVAFLKRNVDVTEG